MNPNRCHGVRSTKLVSSMTENLWVVTEMLVACVRILHVPVLAARAISALRKQHVSLWFESPSDGAMLLSTQRICWANVASLDWIALAQWTSNCSMQFVSA